MAASIKRNRARAQRQGAARRASAMRPKSRSHKAALANPPPAFVAKVAARRGKPRDNRWRKVINVNTVKLVPYGLQGRSQSDLTWYNVSYDPKTGQGVFLVRFTPGGLSIAHEHTGFEEFLMLEGDLIDSDGTLYKAGDFVSLKPGSRHMSYSPSGLYVLVVLRGGKGFRTLGPRERINIR